MSEERGGVIFHGYGSISNQALHHLLRDHYLKRKPPMSDTFEWRRDDRVLAVLTLGVPASRSLQIGVCRQEPDLVVELNRLWIAEDQPRNTASWFIAQCLKECPPKIIVSFADTIESHDGTVYRAANFHYAGWTDMERKTPRFHYKHVKTVTDLFGSRDIIGHDRHTDKSQAERIRRKPKAKYWTVTGTKKDKKRLRELCQWPILSWKEYPVPGEHMMLKL